MFRFIWILIRGFVGNRGVLLALQNNYELRGGGGFITKMVLVRRFKVKFFDVFEDLKLDRKFEAPDFLKVGLGKSYQSLEIRDAAFDFDWNTNGARILEMFNSRTGEPIEAVVGINFSLVEDLYSFVVGPRDLFYQISAETSDIDRHSLDDLRTRKDVVKTIGRDLVKFGLIKFWKWGGIIKKMKEALNKKDLQLFQNGDDDKVIFKGDFLAIVENNLIGGKSNRYVRRSVKHSSFFSAGKMISNLEIEWFHCGSFDPPISVPYRAWCEVLLPLDAGLLTKLDDKIFKTKKLIDCLKVSFPLKINVLGGKANCSFRYETVFSADYSFRYFKQAGLKNEVLMKSINFSRAYMIKEASGRSEKEEVYFWNGEVEGDLNFDFKLEKRERNLRVFRHEIVNPSCVEVFFNEVIALDDEADFVLFDVESDNQFEAKSTEIKGNVLKLNFGQLPNEPEKFYRLEMRNVRGVETGNELKNNFRKLTVVYRPENFKEGER